nr:MAG TPA: hypothetical protein [Caudoviricetes sp.]DAI60081.1 MAG TPA: hypothetical protein [Caudoviricetes sp.]
MALTALIRGGGAARGVAMARLSSIGRAMLGKGKARRCKAKAMR